MCDVHINYKIKYIKIYLLIYLVRHIHRESKGENNNLISP